MAKPITWVGIDHDRRSLTVAVVLLDRTMINYAFSPNTTDTRTV